MLCRDIIGKEVAIYHWLLQWRDVTHTVSFAVKPPFMLCSPQRGLFCLFLISFKVKLMFFKQKSIFHCTSCPSSAHPCPWWSPKEQNFPPGCSEAWHDSANLFLLGCEQQQPGAITCPCQHLATAESRMWRQTQSYCSYHLVLPRLRWPSNSS